LPTPIFRPASVFKDHPNQVTLVKNLELDVDTIGVSCPSNSVIHLTVEASECLKKAGLYLYQARSDLFAFGSDDASWLEAIDRLGALPQIPQPGRNRVPFQFVIMH